MDTRLAESINTFGASPKAPFESPDDPIIEFRASELQALLNEMVLTYNQLAEAVKNTGIRGRELARMTAKAIEGLKAAQSPIEKLHLICAYSRQLLSKLRGQPRQAGKVLQVVSKIQARAVRIIDYIQEKAEGRKEVAIDSKEARTLLAGSGEKVSRKECIRAMHRAEKLCPALSCGHRPNDGRRTMRLTGIADSFTWQRSGLSV